MRRDFSFSSQRGRDARRRLIAATLLVIVIFLFDAVLGGRLRAGLQSMVSGVWNASASARLSIENSGYFASHSSLAHDNAVLRDEIASVQEDAAAYQGLKQENDELRAMLHLASTTRGITAPVVSSFSTSPYGTFLIGAGTADGVGKGSIVMTSEDFVIGTVSDANTNESLVTSIFASGSNVDALIGKSAGIVRGRGGGNAVVTLPREAKVAQNDAVIAPSLGSRQIGIVGHVDASESSADQTVYIQLPLNLSTLRFVYIVPKE